MNITSMSNRELYKTLTGYDYPHDAVSGYNPQNNGVVELNATLNIGRNIDTFKALNEIPSNIEQCKDGTNILKRDRFEFSNGNFGGQIQNSTTKTSSDSLEYTNDIDFNDWYTNLVIQTRSLTALSGGIVGGVPTKERIAEYYGKMAKRLDEAYAEGKFTKEEYDYLNEGIAERMEHSAACAEESAARREVGYKNSMSQKSFERRMSMTREERKADLEAEIKEYIERFFKIDRKSLMEMFNSIRFGK